MRHAEHTHPLLVPRPTNHMQPKYNLPSLSVYTTSNIPKLCKHVLIFIYNEDILYQSIIYNYYFSIFNFLSIPQKTSSAKSHINISS